MIQLPEMGCESLVLGDKLIRVSSQYEPVRNATVYHIPDSNAVGFDCVGDAQCYVRASLESIGWSTIKDYSDKYNSALVKVAPVTLDSMYGLLSNTLKSKVRNPDNALW